MQWLRRCSPVALGAVLAALAAGCGGGGGEPTPLAAAATRSCLEEAGLRIEPVQRLDLIGRTASNGGFHVRLGRTNEVTIAFGADEAEAQRLQNGYERAAGNPVAEVDRNAVLVWTVSPSDVEGETVRACLK